MTTQRKARTWTRWVHVTHDDEVDGSLVLDNLGDQFHRRRDAYGWRDGKGRPIPVIKVRITEVLPARRRRGGRTG